MGEIEKTLDNLVRIYVKKRYHYCYICGTTENLQVGHAWSRRNYAARWNLEVIRAECLKCNYYDDQNNKKFREALKMEIGEKKYKKLEEKMKKNSEKIVEIKKALLELAEAFDKLGENDLAKQCIRLFEKI